VSVTSEPRATAAGCKNGENSLLLPLPSTLEGDHLEGALFTVDVSWSPDGAGGQAGAWSIWLSQGDPSERRLLGWVESPEKPLCALCERPTAHGGVAAVAFSRADGSVELHELDAEGNVIHPGLG
jgi:hypothetical protein